MIHIASAMMMACAVSPLGTLDYMGYAAIDWTNSNAVRGIRIRS